MNGAQPKDAFEDVALPAGPLHLAIGIFDGVHRGHRAVIEGAVRAARVEQGACAVLTFWPHPSVVFRPEDPTRLMLERKAKDEVLRSLGVDAVITQPFTPEFAGVSADNFLPWLKAKLPALAAIHVGGNFRFGQGRKGDVALLTEAARKEGIRIVSAPPVNVDGAVVSSTRVRAQLQAGDIEAVNALLGYTYFASGAVTSGKKLGRTIGFPTLNVPWSPELTPRHGVYAVRISGAKSPTALPAVANYGLRPTVENSTEPRLEVHVLGACPFDTGDTIQVEWLRFLRPEMKFAGIDELRAQIGRDRDAAGKYFAA